MPSEQVIATTLTPLGSRVLAKRTAPAEKTKGILLLPDSAKKKQELAEVVAVGPGMHTKEGVIHPLPLQVGDKILLEKYAGQEVTLNDEEFVIIKFEDIIAIVN